jgi:hypothetical protein
MADEAPVENFAQRWKRVGPLLEAIRREELRRFNFEENWHIVDGLFQLGSDQAVERKTSGLVEMQRWFAKAREKLQREAPISQAKPKDEQ